MERLERFVHARVIGRVFGKWLKVEILEANTLKYVQNGKNAKGKFFSKVSSKIRYK